MTSLRWICLCAGLAVALASGVVAQTSETAQPAAKPPAKLTVGQVVARPWPRTYEQDGVTITLHQPQLDDWQGNTLSGRLAVAVKTGTQSDAEGKSHDKLAYGAMWFKARTDVDKVARKVKLFDVGVDKVSFPTDRANEPKYADLLKKIVASHTPQDVSLDQLESALAISREVKAGSSVGAVRNDPPDVLFSFQPALLVLIDGKPVLKPSGTAGVERVVNTRSLVLKQADHYYIYFAKRWVTAPALAGPWVSTTTVSAALDQAEAAAAQSKLVDLLDEPPDALKQDLAAGKVPAILVSSKPAELITFDGDPEFVDIPGTSLAYVSNTPSDVFIDQSHENFWYVLISGRWFAAPATTGPWSYVASNVLPGDFAKIPSDNPKSAVLASIQGTPEARESLIANAIPQTAT
ncbi:MAG TPA: hypothetical protein VH375_00610, partial [Rhodanobacteraceae bacterium]